MLIQARGDWTGKVVTLLRTHGQPSAIQQNNLFSPPFSYHKPCQNLLLQSSQSYSCSCPAISEHSTSQNVINSHYLPAYTCKTLPLQKESNKKCLPLYSSSLGNDKSYILNANEPSLTLRSGITDDNVCHCTLYMNDNFSPHEQDSHNPMWYKMPDTCSHTHKMQKCSSSYVDNLNTNINGVGVMTTPKKYPKLESHKVVLAQDYSYSQHNRLIRVEADWNDCITETAEEKSPQDIHIPLLADIR